MRADNSPNCNHSDNPAYEYPHGGAPWASILWSSIYVADLCAVEVLGVMSDSAMMHLLVSIGRESRQTTEGAVSILFQ